MLKSIIFAVVGICLTLGQQHRVNIQYNEPRLTLSLNINDPDVTRVIFHYGVRVASHVTQGNQTANGFEVQTDLQTRAGDNIVAYAVVHYRNFVTLTTSASTHHVGGGAVLPPSRRVRAVTFRDDFNNYNQANWNPEISMFGGMNWEFQVYTPESKNIYASGGNLFLRPTLTTDDPRFDENFLRTGVMDVARIWGRCTNDGNYGCNRDGHNGLLPPVMSGKVSSVPTALYGSVEVRAKIPQGDWLWPAIWMMPRDSKYGGWPRSGEIDIMESRGNGGDIGVNTVSSTLHWGPAWDQNRWDLTHGERTNGNYHNDFHTWRLDWNQDHLITYVDNNRIVDVEVGAGFWQKGGFSGSNPWAGGGHSAPFDQPFFLMLNVAVGGTNGYFPDNGNYGGARKPWANNSPHAADDFWGARNDWLPSWRGDETALIVDYVQFSN
ncbi:unnamed protein product [Candidula unifasciata]|uniref:GH16 domain-containing protein n=1 Tax=Candidula unifasciata TaxID=100452 RepID=A0A8S3ZR19_9EUPU|nr:unnamed protein product [Candidula unifasciata]